jgi:hypothetical protein
MDKITFIYKTKNQHTECVYTPITDILFVRDQYVKLTSKLTTKLEWGD